MLLMFSTPLLNTEGYVGNRAQWPPFPSGVRSKEEGDVPYRKAQRSRTSMGGRSSSSLFCSLSCTAIAAFSLPPPSFWSRISDPSSLRFPGFFRVFLFPPSVNAIVTFGVWLCTFLGFSLQAESPGPSILPFLPPPLFSLTRAPPLRPCPPL